MSLLDKKISRKQFITVILTGGLLVILGEMVNASAIGYVFRRTDRTQYDVDMIDPIGSIKMFGGDPTSPPKGWLLCNDQEVSRTTYAALFAVIGTKFGIGNGTTTFNLPNLVQKVPRGTASNACIGVEGGGTHTHTQGTHRHTQNSTGDEVAISCELCEVDAGSDFTVQINCDPCAAEQHSHTNPATGYSSAGTISSTEAWQSYQKFAWIIKY